MAGPTFPGMKRSGSTCDMSRIGHSLLTCRFCGKRSLCSYGGRELTEWGGIGDLGAQFRPHRYRECCPSRWGGRYTRAESFRCSTRLPVKGNPEEKAAVVL